MFAIDWNDAKLRNWLLKRAVMQLILLIILTITLLAWLVTYLKVVSNFKMFRIRS